MKITRLRRGDVPELSQFLNGGFGIAATSSVFSHDVLAWKYFDGPNGTSEESTCSLIARAAGKIIGHIGICPRQFVVAGDAPAPISTMHAIDWLSSTTHPGSGAFLMLQAIATCKTQYAVGGTEQARSLFPRLGFERKSGFTVFRKVLSPFHRWRKTDQNWWRKCAGTAKDLASVWLTHRPKLTQSVELRPAKTFSTEIDCLLSRSSQRLVTCQRDHQLLNYLLRYPRSGFSGWTIHASEQLIGFAVLKMNPNGQLQHAKIVDCWLDTEDPVLWKTAVSELINQLRAQHADDVTCYATGPHLEAAMRWHGFTKWGERDVYLRDKEQVLPKDLPFGFSMLDADGAIL